MMKKLAVLLLLCCFALLPLTGCQSGKTEAEQPAAPTLADLPETQDMTVMVEGTEETVSLSDCTVTGFDSETEGVKTVTVSCQGKTAQFEIQVKASASSGSQQENGAEGQSPQPGDNSMPILWVLCSMVSLCLIVIGQKRYKKIHS